MAPGEDARWRRAVGWVRRHPLRAGSGLLVAGVLFLNLLAFQHAGAMTTFAAEGSATARPEDLSWAGRAGSLLFGVTVRRPANARTPAALGLPFRAEPLVARDGVRLEAWVVEREAARGVAVLGHGYAASKEDLLPAARELHALGFTCVLLDFRGSGGSEGRVTTLGVHEGRDVAAAMALAERLAGSRPVVLFGTSMGAAAALRAIHAEGARPAALILEAPFNRLLDTVRNRFDLMGVPSWPSAELLVLWGGVRRGIDGFGHAPAVYAGQVRCPTLLLHGERDRRVSLAEAREVFEALPPDRRRLRLLEGVGHESYVRARPDAWRAAVSELLEGLASVPEGGS